MEKLKEKFVMKRGGIRLTDVCTLNCRLCSAHSPYRKSDSSPSLEELCEWVKRFFKIADFCDKFSITGGEPLLYPKFPEFMEYLLNYSDSIGKVEVLTNGTIVPSESLLSEIKKYGNKFFRFLIDDYGKELSTKITEIVSKLDIFDIPYEIRDYHSENPHCGGWVDTRISEEVIHTPKEAHEIFMKCSVTQDKLSYCFVIYYGNLLPCPNVGRRLDMGIAQPNEYIKLMEDSISVEEHRQKITDMYNRKYYFETCAYCNGMCDDSPRFKPAEQLSAEELAEIKMKRRRESQ